MPRIVLDALALLVAAGLAVLALPGDEVAPGGIPLPSGAVVAAGATSVLILLSGVVAVSAVGPRPAAWLGLLIAASAVSIDAVSSTAIPALVSSVAALLGFAAVPAVVHMALAWPATWPHRRTEQVLTAATWTLILGAGLAWVLVWDPFSDVTCVLRCGVNPLAVHADPELARGVLRAAQLAAVASCGITASLVLRPSRFWPGGLAALLLGADAVVRLAVEQPMGVNLAVRLYQTRSLALIVIGSALLGVAGQRIRRHRRLLRLAESIDAAAAPGTFVASLREALDDPQLSIAYAASGHRGFVSADGQPFAGAGAGQVTTRLVRNEVDVAVIAHRPDDAVAISTDLGAAARLVIDNERIAADMRARIVELRVSRERIVERSDAERLRLERDVHDGAQQRLLMLGHDLRTASREDPDLLAKLAPVIRDVDEALAELRNVAHGIYPGILESYGLRAALDALADGPVPMVLVSAPAGRVAAPVERAAYLVVSTALRGQSWHQDPNKNPPPLSASLVIEGSLLHLTITGLDGMPPSDFQALQDHVGALGGTVEMHGTTLDCELPCAAS